MFMLDDRAVQGARPVPTLSANAGRSVLVM